jgi:hypothetical protein
MISGRTLKALQSLLNVVDLLSVDGRACAPLQSKLINETGQDSEIITSFWSGPGLTPSQKTGYPAAILRRAGSIPFEANGIGPLRVSLMPALEAYLVLPGTIEIVLVAETGSLAEAKLGECNIRRPGCQL